MDLSQGIFAITLLASDLAKTKDFYERVFEPATVYQDETSVVFKFGSNLVNILGTAAVGDLFGPAGVGELGQGHRSLLTVQVVDVDAEFARLTSQAIAINTPPTNQPWGIRTITFADPTGQMWELSMPIPEGAK